MSDLIRREDAIDAVRLATVETRSIGMGDILYILYSIPSAEQVTGKLKNPCDSLLKTDSEACKEQKSKLELISRADAIDAIEELPNAYNGWSDAYDKACIIGALEEVPSAEPKTGEWVMLEMVENVHDIYGVPTWGVNYMCDKCGFITTAIQDHFSQYKFCPSCGARMNGGEEE